MKIADFKFFLLLDSMKEKEIKEFRKLVSSFFFSGGRNYIQILNKLLKIRKKGLEKITPQILYKKLYPGSRFSLQTLNNRFSELFKLGEEFMIQKTLRENKPERDRLLLLAYHNDKSKKLFSNRLNSAKKSVDAMPESDTK